jgi:nicotinate-nucleotide adenylyltransferase
MKLAILGSSFNPIHLGHLIAADEVLSELHYDRVVLVPAYRSPFKLATSGMEDSTHARLEMAAAAIAGNPQLAIDDCEIRRGGVSCTVDTVAAIIRRYAPE